MVLGWKDVSNYTFHVVTLLEAVQLEWLIAYQNLDKLSVLLNHYPEVSLHIKHKIPHLRETIDDIENRTTSIEYSLEMEKQFVCTLEDWIVYVVDPESYDKQEHNNWDTMELLSLIDFTDMTVVDIGAGTGSQTFRMAPLAKTIYAVEPVGNMRQYLKAKAKKLGFNNVYTVDGLMTDLPYPNQFCDVVVSGHVFGDEPEAEFQEMMRVVKTGGMIILIPGNNDVDNDIHYFLVDHGFEFAAFYEPKDGMKRKYWKVKR